MEELLQWMEYIEDVRQQSKVRHLLKDILVIVLFATLANADDWVEIALFAQVYEDYLKKYIELRNDPPSYDTIQRVMGMISPDILQQLYGKWQELLNREEGEALKKIICIDGKTMRSNKQGNQKPSHIVTAWSREDYFRLGQKAIAEKSNDGDSRTSGKTTEKRTDSNDRRNGNTDRNRRKNMWKKGRLCAGMERESGDVARRRKRIFCR